MQVASVSAVIAAMAAHFGDLADLTPTPVRRGDGYLSSQDYRRAMSALPTGVSVLTTEHPAGAWGMTVGSLTSLSLEPPLLLVCLRKGSATLRALARSGSFAISVLSSDQADLAQAYAAPRCHLSASELTVVGGALVLPGATAWFTCEHRHTYLAGDHTIVIGAVTDAAATDAPPLLRHASQYRTVSATDNI
jgi:flavin reductase (DIM6/NTAB) family NADH-FMN oxidoreductase RutF